MYHLKNIFCNIYISLFLLNFFLIWYFCLWLHFFNCYGLCIMCISQILYKKLFYFEKSIHVPYYGVLYKKIEHTKDKLLYKFLKKIFVIHFLNFAFLTPFNTL
ncbi:hypothetical protein EDEG_02348 [Edhazardia aedis USNM 41457]|uniref:Uncharacterized protein n=1 Tax=Edhazardia aedis (strain USNM 41457) TaxID=1003232 RepID=J9DPK0_EDHAE|nr:hypothetical protein EDEG_02348 [Edhazardia aedis USNM 41457]|eukprot:EJW03282.1 hypothetical protein EDEG_02348 [Edhazardia aedis USNM 41457]